MTLAEEHRFHNAAVNAAAVAVDAARAAADAAAEATAIETLTAAAAARQSFLVKLRRAAICEIDTYAANRAPGRKFWEPPQ